MTDPIIPPTPSDEVYAAQTRQPDTSLFEDDDPIAIFARWFAQAQQTEPADPHACVLASVGADGAPDARTVLMKGFEGGRFIIHTNRESAKGGQLLTEPRAALVFHWKSLGRQVRVRGPATPIEQSEADAYYGQRAVGSRIGAIASRQSRPIASREELAGRIAELEAHYKGGAPERPAYWRGFAVTALELEFWQDREFRIHDRRLFTRPAPGAGWRSMRLQP